jgi:hypothetical protein
MVGLLGSAISIHYSLALAAACFVVLITAGRARLARAL